MRIRMFVATLVLTCVRISGAAETKTVNVAGRNIELTIPAGMCWFDERNELERGALEEQRRVEAERNLVLAGMADCDELKAYRAGKIGMLNRFGYVKSPLTTLQMSRQEFVQIITRQFESQGATPIDFGALYRKIDEQGGGVKLRDIEILGFAFKEPEMVGVVSRARLIEGGLSRDRVGVLTATAVEGVPISIMLSQDYRDPSTITALSERAKAVTEALLGLNR